MSLSILAVFSAIAGTWWVHRNEMDLTPIFRYDTTWPTAQVVLTVLAVAVLMGIFGNMVDLAIKDE
jgi:predicted lysophospholipase L1 biosynthesis ABC-type transport system permease subunit